MGSDPSMVPAAVHSSIATAVEAFDVPGPMWTTRNVSVLHAAFASHAFELSGEVEQIVPAGRLGFDAVPLVQMSLVQGLPSTGGWLSSWAGTTAPAPSQPCFLQLPASSGPAAVPCGWSEWPQVWLAPAPGGGRPAGVAPRQTPAAPPCT